jgi:hypothetical protein
VKRASAEQAGLARVFVVTRATDDLTRAFADSVTTDGFDFDFDFCF